MNPLPRDAYYVGCVGDTGHYMWDAELRKDWHWFKQVPWGVRIDGTIPPPRNYEQGVARLEHLEGWTAVGFWDNTVDSRPGSHSTFVFRGTLTYEEAIAKARATFPTIWARFNFEVREATS